MAHTQPHTSSATPQPANVPEAAQGSHPYTHLLEGILKPARYLGGESGERRKDWASVECRVCLAFPDLYDIGMSHLGYRILYKILNDHPAMVAERCYTPWVDMQARLREAGEPLRSLESARPLSDFDVVGFSLQFELTYTNVLCMLDLGGIPLRAAERGEADPLVVAGGPVATHAEPLAPFIDAFVIGDGEELAVELALCWQETGAAGLARHERLKALARLKGVYVPALYAVTRDAESGLCVVSAGEPDAELPVERRLIDDLEKFPFPDDGPVGGPEAIFDRVSIEVARGCTEGCRFCQAGMIYRPVRERPPQQVVKTVLKALEKSGHDEVSLTALSTADVSCISPLIRDLVERTAPQRVSLSVASLRAYGLAEDLLDDMRRVRAGGLTFAPEAGTQRMRDVINKNVTEAQLMETAERVFSRGFEVMKLYFIIGLPTEQDEDVLGIVEVARNALAVANRVGNRRARITVSVSTHVPKPHTPFQWCAMDSLESIDRKHQLLRRALGRHKRIGLRLHSPKPSVLEGVFARGDRGLADVLEDAYRHGACFDSWDDQLNVSAWEKAFAAGGVEPERLLGTLPIGGRLPWDHLDIGLEDGFLAREYRKAVSGRLSPPCGKAKGMFVHHDNAQSAEADARRLVCYDCGIACDMTHMRQERLVELRKMGALVPRPAAAAAQPIALRRQHPEDARPKQPGLRRVRYGLRYEKLGPVALLGHLDFMREVGRTLRRAGLKAAYSQGFRPKPRLTFGPALALGVFGLKEAMEVELLDPPPPEVALKSLNASGPRGLRFTQARVSQAGEPTLGTAICGARYLFVFARQVTDEQTLEAQVQAFLARERVTIKRTVKGIARMVNVRERVQHLKLAGPDGLEIASRAGLAGDFVTLMAEVVLEPKGSVKPAEVVESLFGSPVPPFQCVRVEVVARQQPEPECEVAAAVSA